MISVQAKDIENDAQTSKTFKYNNWIYWQQSFTAHLKVKKGMTLYYIILPDTCNISPGDMTEYYNIIYNTTHNTRAFTINNKTIQFNLYDLTTGTDDADCIKI